MSLAPREVRPAQSVRSTGLARSNGRPLHRISEVRKRQGVSIRSVARQIKVDVRQARLQEDSQADLQVSTLYEWQKALGVPVVELLVLRHRRAHLEPLQTTVAIDVTATTSVARQLTLMD